MAGSKMVVIYPNGETAEEPYTPDEDGGPPLERMQGHVGGYVEQVPGMVTYAGKLRCAFVNEDGILHGLPVNHYASRLVRHMHRIHGNMVIVVPEDSPGSTESK